MSAMGTCEVGIFARTFERSSLSQVLEAIQDSGFSSFHFNFRCAGMAALPAHLTATQCRGIREEVEHLGLSMLGVSATCNLIHPDESRRVKENVAAKRVVQLAGELGTRIVTLCTGTRDAEDMWRYHPDTQSPEAWGDLLRSLAPLVESAEASNVILGIEPELSNVINSAERARRLFDEMKSPSLGIVFDGVNLVRGHKAADQRSLLTRALDLLAMEVVVIHAKEIGDAELRQRGYAALDYPLYFELLGQSRLAAPIVLHNLRESDAAEAGAYVRAWADRLEDTS